MAHLITLMEQDVSSPALFWTTKLVSARDEDGSLNVWVLEDSAFGQVTSKVATNVASPEQLISVLIAVSDWSELQINSDVIAEQISPRLAALDRDFAEGLKQEANYRSLQRRQKATAA